MRHTDDIRETWTWHIRRLFAEYLHSPSVEREAQLLFHLASYRHLAARPHTVEQTPPMMAASRMPIPPTNPDSGRFST